MGQDLEYWSGATWVLRAIITNDACCSGTHNYAVVPGEGSEMEILYGTTTNADSAGRVASVRILDADGGNVLTSFGELTITAGERFPFPSSDGSLSGTHTEIAARAGNRYTVSGTMALEFNIAAIAVNQDSRFAVVCRIRGSVPTVTLTSPSGATEAVSTNKVF